MNYFMIKALGHTQYGLTHVDGLKQNLSICELDYHHVRHMFC